MVALVIAVGVVALGGVLGLGYWIVARHEYDVPATQRAIRRAQRRQRADLRTALRRSR